MPDILKLFSHVRAAPEPVDNRAPDAPAAQASHAPALPADSHFARLSNAVSRTGARFKSNRFDVSTAVYQKSSLGASFAPADFVAGGKRYDPKPNIKTAPPTSVTPLSRADKNARQALTRLSHGPSSQSNPVGRYGAQEEADSMDSDAALRAHVTRAFPGAPNNLLIGAELAHRLVALGAPEGSPPTARGALIANAMQRAHIDNAQDASDALDQLAHLDFSALDDSRSTSAPQARGWLLARVLSRSGAGFEALEHLRQVQGRTPAASDATTRAAQRMMLETADALDPAGSLTRDPAPGAVAARHAPLPSANLHDAPLAWRAYASASTLIKHGPQALTADQKGAFFAWQQNFREDGPGSELSRARERLNKFSAKTIGNVATPRWKTFFPRLVGKQRSPLTALQIGLQGLPRKQVGAEVAALQQTMRDALPALRDSPAMQPQAALAHARPEQSIAELAAMQVWLESGGFPNGTVDAAHVGRIAERARELCADLRADQVASPAVLERMQTQTREWANAEPAALLHSAPFKSMAGPPFNIERLASWGKVAKVPAASPFWTQVDELKNAARPEPFKPAAHSADAAREALLDVASHLQGGSRLRLTDGSRVGVSTRGLSANVGKLLNLHGVPLAPRIDLRKSRAREAVVELSMSTHGSEMFLGTAKTDQQFAAVGVLVGYDVDVGLTRMRAGVATQAVLHSEELVNPSGVTLRVARRVKPDGSGFDDAAVRDTMASLVNHVFDESTHAAAGGSRATWNRLAEHCFDNPDVSVSWTDTLSREVKRGGSADASATFQPTRAITEARFGPNAGIGYEKITQQTLDSKERSGRIQLEQHRAGGGSRWLARLSGGLSNSVTLGSGDRSAGVGIMSVDAPSLTVPITDSTHLAKVQLVRENGMLNHRGCLFETEYASARTYTHAIDSRREQWIDLFATQTLDEQAKERAEAARTGSAVPPQPNAREVAAERLDRHLGDVKANRRMNQRFFHRHRLTSSAAKKIDVLETLRDGAGPSPHNAPLDQKIDRILSDPASWMPIELKVKERTSARPSRGLNLALQLNTQTSATGDRELFAEGIPFELLERLDR